MIVVGLLVGLLVGLGAGFHLATLDDVDQFLRLLGKVSDDGDVMILNPALRAKVEEAMKP